MIILVMGMHRSGTSALAGMLHHGGIFMGEQLVGKSRNNPKGHYEDRALLSLDNRILRHLNGSWRKVPENIHWKHISIIIFSQMTALHKKYSDYKVRGWKDPRMAVLFPAWHQVLKDEDEIVFLHIVRHPKEVAQSLQKRHGKFPDKEAYELWGLHNQSIKSNAEKYNIRRLVIDFSDLVQFPRAMKEKVENFIYRPLDSEAYKFIEKKHKHWNVQKITSHDYTNIPKLLQET
jgi:hypothetical protein